MDPRQDEETKYYGSENEPIDSKLFSPLRSQLQAELGSSSLFYSDSNYFGFEANANANAGQLQSGAEESDYIYHLIDSFVLDDYLLEDLQQEVISQSEFPNNTVASLENGFHGVVEAENAKAMVSGTFIL